MSATERLFFALWPGSEQQKAWAAMANELLPTGVGRLVSATNLHMTLLYVGTVAADRRKGLEVMAAETCFAPFVLRLDKLGYWRKPRVLWWGPTQTPEALLGLVQSLRAGAGRCGIEVDSRPYKAHMTMARKVVREPEHVVVQPCDWAVDHFALVRSVSSPAGVRYEPLQQWPAQQKTDFTGDF